LNKQQLEAVEYCESHLLINAGVGTGKTETLMTKYVYLLTHEGYQENEVLAITFTNKAAREMEERIKKINKDMENMWIGTFHSIALKMLRQKGV
jgi:DNA helicase-2/ATP-dependent DNA helicase PcrA